MCSISFIHCSDIHLGCQQYNEPQRWLDFGQTFAEIVAYAINHKVNYFLIGGDLFHHRSINAQTLEQAIIELKKLRDAGIQVVAIEGNHDKAFYLEGQSWMDFLNAEGYIHLLKPDIHEGRILLNKYDGQRGCVIEVDGIRIIGLGYLGATTKQRLEEISENIQGSDNFTVMLLHAAVDKLMGQDMAGVNSKVFEKFNGVIDYLALGHIHSRQEQDGYIYNPGAPEAVHIDESRNNKEKGFYHVSISDKGKTVKFIESNRRNIHYIDIDLSGTINPSDVTEKITEQMDRLQIKEKSLVQIVLYGMVDFCSYAIDISEISETIKSSYHCLVVEIVNNTNLQELQEDSQYDQFDRVSIERHVIKKMIQQEKPECKEIEDRFVDLVLKIKNHSAAEYRPEDIITFIDEIMGDMLLSSNEAAVVGEGAYEHED